MTTHTLDEAAQTLRLTLPGDLLSTNFDKLNAEIDAILARPEVASGKWATLVLDLTAARLIDSMGLNILVGLVKRVQAAPRHGRVRARIASQTIHRTLLFTRLEKYMEVELIDPAGK